MFRPRPATMMAGLAVVVDATPAAADEPRNGRISRAEIISRAQDWFQRQIPYNQLDSATDVEG